MNPIEIAKSFKSLIQTTGLTQEEVAKKVSKNRSSIANFLRLLTLPKNIQEALEKKKISMGHAKALMSIKDPAFQLEVFHEIVIKKINVREAERLAKKKDGLPLQDDIHLKEMVREVEVYLGTRVTLEGDQERGKLCIEYFGLSDLERLLEIFLLIPK